MANGPSFIQTVTPAIIGLIGVGVGGALTTWRERSTEKRIEIKDAALLAAVIGGELDGFIAACNEVVQDDGETNPDTGFWEETTATPTFDPSKYDVEWRSIHEKIMFDIHDLPYQISFSNGAIRAVGEHDSPPDFSDWFQERQYQYARLGLHCLDILERLRGSAKLVPRPKTYEWNPRQIFQDKIEAIELRKAESQGSGST
ncbi:hypothetical protein [Stenotrophomonas sp. Iso1]|uniref:hypothetical protein n=1 Tax=Stenotrophomonas sp. Iso1 TaxID=2977283 RepID=UPI0022B7D162|nr:hypothetical protein [Stenotrophomonas sp. Iso1]